MEGDGQSAAAPGDQGSEGQQQQGQQQQQQQHQHQQQQSRVSQFYQPVRPLPQQGALQSSSQHQPYSVGPGAYGQPQETQQLGQTQYSLGSTPAEPHYSYPPYQPYNPAISQPQSQDYGAYQSPLPFYLPSQSQQFPSAFAASPRNSQSQQYSSSPYSSRSQQPTSFGTYMTSRSSEEMPSTYPALQPPRATQSYQSPAQQPVQSGLQPSSSTDSALQCVNAAEEQMAAILDDVDALKLVPAMQKILQLSRWFLARRYLTAMYLTQDELPDPNWPRPNWLESRRDLWRAFNTCWLTLAQRAKQMLLDQTRNQGFLTPGQTRLRLNDVSELGNTLTQLCDELGDTGRPNEYNLGLVDYEMGVLETRILDALSQCRELAIQIEQSHSGHHTGLQPHT